MCKHLKINGFSTCPGEGLVVAIMSKLVEKRDTRVWTRRPVGDDNCTPVSCLSRRRNSRCFERRGEG